jgi:Uma2 family endonuclease
MSAAIERLTVAEFLAREWPRQTELIDEVVVVNEPRPPDVLWFAGPPALDGSGPRRDPDLVVEVRSPSTWRYDLGRKRELYVEHGVPELWLVDTVARRVLVHRSDGR